MVFHLLRQEVGEEPFWRALKQFVHSIVAVVQIGAISSEYLATRRERPPLVFRAMDRTKRRP